MVPKENPVSWGMHCPPNLANVLTTQYNLIMIINGNKKVGFSALFNARKYVMCQFQFMLMIVATEAESGSCFFFFQIN